MATPTRVPAGERTISVSSANLFEVAAQYLGDATAWERISDINGIPGVAPDFLLTGLTALQIPAPRSQAGKPAPSASTESLFASS